jgi:hypothetical protein
VRTVVILTSEAEKQNRAQNMKEINNILASFAKRKEKVTHDIPILDYLFSPKLNARVGIYEAPKRMTSLSVKGRKVKRT